MENQNIKDHVLEIISGKNTGILSSVEGNKPHSRYMTFFNDDLTLYTPTDITTEKVAEIENNPSVSVLLGYEGKGLDDCYVEIAGKSTINQSKDLKQQFWDDSFQKYFHGPEDPNYAFLQIQPETIRVLNNHGEPPQELNV